MGFSERKSIEELAAEQGVKLEGQLKRIVGSGAHLWSNAEEFEEFVQGTVKHFQQFGAEVRKRIRTP